MTNKFLPLNDRLHDYLLSVSLREPELLRRLREETALLPQAQMQISAEQGQFMRLLIELIGARKALEVGVFTGYSSLCVALALPVDGHMVACDMSDEWTQIARRYWREAGVTEKISLRLQPGRETLDELIAGGEAETFDFAFIDADKSNYEVYYEQALMLVRPGALIVVDNVLWSGRVADEADQETDTVAIRAFNRKLHADERVTISLVPVADGLTLARKRG